MKIQIAGPGCPRCQATEINIKAACAELDITADISHLTDMLEFGRLGVMLTPAVVLDGKVISSGKVPTVQELVELLSKDSTTS